MQRRRTHYDTHAMARLGHDQPHRSNDLHFETLIRFSNSVFIVSRINNLATFWGTYRTIVCFCV